MTEDKEKELFDTLSTLVHGVSGLKSDVRDIKVVLDKHSHILDRHSEVLDRHSDMHNEHSSKLNSLVSKVDSIAEQVMENDKRLSARIVAVEQAVGNLGCEIH
jgi:hypothetical protein